MINTVVITNPAAKNGPAFLAMVYRADDQGKVDAQPIQSRRVPPGITAILGLSPGNYLVIQHAPEQPPAKCGTDCEDWED